MPPGWYASFARWHQLPLMRGPRTLREIAEVAREICLRQLAVRPRTRAELVGMGYDPARGASHHLGPAGLHLHPQ